VLLQVLGTELVQRSQRKNPVILRCGRAVDQDDLLQRRRLGPVVPQLVQLGRVLGEHDLHLGVRDDVGDVGRHRGRVDRGRRGGSEDGGQVALDPLHPGARRDRDALLGLYAEGDQARRPTARQFVEVPPAGGFPLVP
jgi:hypothetical protein